MKNKKIFIVLSVVALAIIGVAILFFILQNYALNQPLEVRGYQISIPTKWSGDSKGNFYNQEGEQAGKFILIGEPVTKNNATEVCGDEIKGDVNFNEITDNLTEYTFETSNGETKMYLITNIENPEPYAAAVVEYTAFSKKVGKRIAKTFKAPEIGKNPPKKNIKAPSLKTIGENALAKIEYSDGTVSVLNGKALDVFSEKLNSNTTAGVDVLYYRENNGVMTFISWHYLESDGNAGYMYTYYHKADSLYTYDNDVMKFQELSKKISEDEETISYFLKSDERDNIRVIALPLKKYRENAEALFAMKMDITDYSGLKQIFQKIMSAFEIKNLKTEISENTLTISFGEGVKPDSSRAYSHAAIIFALTEDITTVKVIYSNGNVYKFTKDQVAKTIKTDIKSAAQNKESFENFVEEIEKAENSKNLEQTQQQSPVFEGIEDTTDSALGGIVYTGSVTISYNTMVTHPRTGEKVAIGPYAEERGYGGYLGKPISCIIRRSGSGYIATASCGGKTIMSYPLNDESQLNWAISMIKAYS